MKHCYRCGEIKDGYRFRPGQPYWHCWCIRCERTPIGKMPLPQTQEDIWREASEVQRKS
ncbi:protein ninD [Serratia marcescens]|uniref:protein NinD n=1 Tax=Serratia marcescens TaxID=615 RepID=UPI00221FE121|nr:protein NinD [Serratia marcescens]UYU05085.1 protein ninD [Serratia marcescens]